MKRSDLFLTASSSGNLKQLTESEIKTGFSENTLARDDEVNFQLNRHERDIFSMNDEMFNVLDAEGITPDQNDNTQLLQALDQRFQPVGGALPEKFVNDEIVYGGEFDASLQYPDQVIGDIYNYNDYSINPDGTSRSIFISTNGYSASDFEAKIKFMFFSSNNTKPLIGLGSGAGSLGIVVKTNTSGLMQMFISSNGTSWDISNGLTGGHVYSIDTIYNVRVRRDVNNWYLDYSTDNGQTWINDITANSSLDMFEQTLNFNWGGDFTPATDVFMTGKIFLEDTSLFLNGEFVARPQDVPFVPNTVGWKGKARSENNTADLVANDFIYSSPVFDARSQYQEIGGGISYDVNDFSYSFTGATQGIAGTFTSFLNFSAPDFKSQIKFRLNENTSEPLNSQSGVNPSICYKSYIQAGKFTLWLSSDGSNWDIANAVSGTFDFLTGVDYVVRVYKTATQWIADYSTDNGQTWTNDITINDSRALVQNRNYGYLLGGDESLISPRFYMNGKIYLDNTFVEADGRVAIKPQLASQYVQPYTDLYYFVGYDNLNNLKAEFTENKDGSGLPTITGAKRRLGDDKDVQIPTDGNSELSYFKREFNTWEIDLWTGVSTILVNNGYILNSSYKNFEYLQGLFQESTLSSYPGEIMRKTHIIERARTRLYNTEANFASATFETDTSFKVNQVASNTISMIRMIGVK